MHRLVKQTLGTLVACSWFALFLGVPLAFPEIPANDAAASGWILALSALFLVLVRLGRSGATRKERRTAASAMRSGQPLIWIFSRS